MREGAANGGREPDRVVGFTTADGHEGNVINVRGPRPPDRGPVMLVHGAGVRGNIFRAPVHSNLVDVLVEEGYDVWLENWRASIDFAPNEWTLDRAAAYDHPEAVRTVLRETGTDEMKAIIHCQGSTSFMMSAVAGLVPQVTTIVTNAVSLHPVIPMVSRWKIQYLTPLVKMATRYMDPHWGIEAPTTFAKLIVLLVRAFHHECDNTVCRMVSFTYGTGFPALWRHENLDARTHGWLSSEFGFVPMTFFEQMARCVQRGRLVSVEGLPALPADFLAQPPQTDARFAFFAGKLNRCFSAESQQRTFELFDRRRPNYHSLRVLPSYSHLDVFMGKDAARDVFPLMLDELKR